MKKVIIGIVGKPDNTTDYWNYIEVNDDIKECINEFGALCIGIMPQDHQYQKSGFHNDGLSEEDINNLKDILSIVDGVVLQGGLVSNSYEKEIAKICIENDKPLLGICCGFNDMVEALGGKLYQDTLGIHYKEEIREAHEVRINKNSRLYSIMGTEKILVNSFHNMVAKEDSIKGYSISAICPLDHSVEGIEMTDKKFIVGIKWHPELIKNEESMRKIFEAFVNSCRTFS